MLRFLLVVFLLAGSARADWWSRCRDKFCSIKQKCVALLTREPAEIPEPPAAPADATKIVEFKTVPPPSVEVAVEAPPEVFHSGQLVSIMGVQTKGNIDNALELSQPFVAVVAKDLSQEPAFTIRVYVLQRYRHLPLFGLALGDRFYILSTDGGGEWQEGQQGRVTARWFGDYNPYTQEKVEQASVPNQMLRGTWSIENDFLILRFLNQPRVVR